ncbi:hypothetical protein HJFPF1_08950 [Paramyrothecium foliicola]|nr:hypothetical protein HJFPF1_08950 [Paramyrothecium foliicola]
MQAPASRRQYQGHSTVQHSHWPKLIGSIIAAEGGRAASSWSATLHKGSVVTGQNYSPRYTTTQRPRQERRIHDLRFTSYGGASSGIAEAVTCCLDAIQPFCRPWHRQSQPPVCCVACSSPDSAMATQQVLFSETIAGMKKAFKRKAYEQAIDYAGVRRSIIQRNPPIFDDEGDEVDTDDDDPRAEDAAASAADLNPYANIHIERILSPLIASTDLPTHPTLSKPFTSKTLTELIGQSCGIMRKENQSLWQVRHLWTSLCGDNAWVPCSNLVGPNDIELYTEDHVARHLLNLSKPRLGDASSPQTANGVIAAEGAVGGSATEATNATNGVKGDSDVPMADVGSVAGGLNVTSKPIEEGDLAGEQTQEKEEKTPQVPNDENSKLPEDQPMAEGEQAAKSQQQSDEETGKPAPSQEHADSKAAQLDPTKFEPPSIMTTGTLDEPFIHPIFVAPAGSKPDRDMGLPEYEAEDVRRLLALYVQKQEEICRGAKKLHQGLLRAERLRNEVLHWSKAEAHCGPNRDMSDGEDWYDKEEWGLADDLKKGQDEEEEDTATAGKKTRNRR